MPPSRSRPKAAAKFFGLYRGVVVANQDPQGVGRLSVSCPDVSEVASWAMPCMSLAGPGMGAVLVPPVGAGVWLQFEAGDPDRPVWVGGYWSSAAETPAASQTASPSGPPIVLQSAHQNRLVISDLPGPAGGVLLQTASGAAIRVTDAGITIDNGQGASIVLHGPAVTINGGALEVT